ncbi:MAG: hypothetical protein K2K40_09165 [Paramuribaculum sp.]|nr:hypothetical protein [Paramuribaculum sp.]
MFRKLLAPIAVVAMTVYLVVTLSFTSRNAATQPCAGLRVMVRDSTTHPFVTATELTRELGELPSRIAGMKLADINTDSIEHMLADIDKIEAVRVVTLTDGHLLVDVNPMEPIARVFPTGRRSYYINRSGKRIAASPRYHIDVPVIQGRFADTDTAFTPIKLLPLLDWLDKHPEWGAFVSAIKADSPTDVIIVPMIRGHVVNLGDINALDSKFRRLRTFYELVMPHKGWETYDTISLKWGGQAVATRRDKRMRVIPNLEEIEEEVDTNTMIGVDSLRIAPRRLS